MYLYRNTPFIYHNTLSMRNNPTRQSIRLKKIYYQHALSSTPLVIDRKFYPFFYDFRIFIISKSLANITITILGINHAFPLNMFHMSVNKKSFQLLVTKIFTAYFLATSSAADIGSVKQTVNGKWLFPRFQTLQQENKSRFVTRNTD